MKDQNLIICKIDAGTSSKLKAVLLPAERNVRSNKGMGKDVKVDIKNEARVGLGKFEKC